MPHLAAPDVGNYTFGANQLLVAGVDLGNVVDAAMTVAPAQLTHFSAMFGGELDDAGIITSLGIVIDVTLDEPNKVNIQRWLLSDTTGKVGMGFSATPVAVTFNGIAVVGNSFTWAIPKAFVRPKDTFGMTDQDWVKFALQITLFPDASALTAPYGTFTHNGVA